MAEVVDVFACEECGFDNAALKNSQLADAIGKIARSYPVPLTRFLPNEDGDSLVRKRPADGVWSALEYAAHLRDVIGFYANRIEAIVTTDRPQLEGFDIEAEAERQNYNGLDPAVVANEIATAARALHVRLDKLAPDDWSRVGIALDGTSERDVRNCASRLAHEGVHHLLDIGRSLRAARS